MAGTLNITGLSATEPAGSRQIGPITIQGTVVIGETLATPLTIGDNRFTVPAGTVAALIIPPTASTAELKLRTSANEADTGLLISPANPTVYSLPAAIPTSLIIHASAAVSSPLTIVYI